MLVIVIAVIQSKLFNSQICTELNLPKWAYEVVKSLRHTISHQYFPCLFAKKSLEQDTHFYHFMELVDCPDARKRLKFDLIEYVHFIKSTPLKKRLMVPLIVFVKPLEALVPLAAHHGQAWDLLQYLHDNDPRPWPAEVPTNPDHYLWSFCFAGLQLFVNFSSPEHKKHRSRNVGRSLTLVINPRQHFDVVAGRSAKGRKVRQIIRQRIVSYENKAVPTSLGTYGDAANREWQQYQSEEDSYSQLMKCPLDINSKQQTQLSLEPSVKEKDLVTETD